MSSHPVDEKLTAAMRQVIFHIQLDGASWPSVEGWLRYSQLTGSQACRIHITLASLHVLFNIPRELALEVKLPSTHSYFRAKYVYLRVSSKTPCPGRGCSRTPWPCEKGRATDPKGRHCDGDK